MSLIDDALKQAEKAQQDDPAKTQRVWTPAPLPDRRRIRQARRRAVAVAVVGAAVVCAIVFLFYRSRPRKAAASSAASTAVAAASAASGLPPITSEVTVAPPPVAVAENIGVVRPNRSVARPTVRPPASTAAHESSASIPSAPAARSEEHPEKARPASEPSTATGELTLANGARISLDGIVYSENNPVAVLNGKVLAAGAYVEGARIVSIEPDRVELEADGRKIFLKLR